MPLYLALCYCWGTELKPWLLTTKENVESHKKGIPLNFMPDTLEVAVIVK
jgi:hypothetical protein